MKEILQTIIENLVDNKDAVSIKEEQDDTTIAFEVRVSEDDMGKIIGKQGKIASSIRTIMKSVAAKEHKRISIEFVE